MIRRFLTYFFVAVIAGLLLAITQLDLWETGRQPSDALELVIGGPLVEPVGRIWIDTDAACGTAPRTDPDDCFAIVWLASRGFDITGISTTFGNAAGSVVEKIVETLVQEMTQHHLSDIPVWKGHAEPLLSGTTSTEPGVTALRAALERGPLTILALGPLTNIAAALDGRRDLQRRVTRIVAVMGHRPGHLFHPTEGKGSGALFGHGPIFRDLNFSADSDAASRVLGMNLPVTLIPYDAASSIMITRPDLERFAERGAIFASLTEKARDWLKFWNDDVGLPGFYPFDWVASAYLANPRLFDCAQTKTWIAQEWTFWLIPHRSLLAGTPPAGGDTGFDIIYCPQAAPATHDYLLFLEKPK